MSLRAIDSEKCLHIGSYTSINPGEVEFKEQPPNLIRISLKLLMRQQSLELHVSLAQDEILHHQVIEPPNLKLHNQPLTVNKYARLADKEIYEDKIFVTPDSLILYDRQAGVTSILDLQFNLINEICYQSKQTDVPLTFKMNTQPEILECRLIEDEILVQNNRTPLFQQNITFTPPAPPLGVSFVRPYPQEVRLINSNRNRVQFNIMSPPITQSAPPVLETPTQHQRQNIQNLVSPNVPVDCRVTQSSRH